MHTLLSSNGQRVQRAVDTVVVLGDNRIFFLSHRRDQVERKPMALLLLLLLQQHRIFFAIQSCSLVLVLDSFGRLVGLWERQANDDFRVLSAPALARVAAACRRVVVLSNLRQCSQGGIRQAATLKIEALLVVCFLVFALERQVSCRVSNENPASGRSHLLVHSVLVALSNWRQGLPVVVLN